MNKIAKKACIFKVKALETLLGDKKNLSMEKGNALFIECLCAYKHRKKKLNLSKNAFVELSTKIGPVCAFRHGGS